MSRNSPWLTEQEAQEYLGVSRTTLYRLQCRGKLRVHKLGAQRRYRREDLDAAVEPIEPEGDDDGET